MRLSACLLCFAAFAWAQDPPTDPVAYAVGGRAVDRKGEPAAGLTVQVWDGLVPERFLAQGTTGPKGRFLVALRAGDLERREHPHGPLLVAVQGEGIARQRRRVAAGARDVEIVVGKARVVTGKVLGTDGAPMPALVVRGSVAYGGEVPDGLPSPRVWLETTTGEDGGFALRHLPEGGMLSLELIGEGFVHRAQEGGEIRLPPLQRLAARVRDAETGAPVAEAEFRTVSSLGVRVAGVTDAAGRFSVPALEAEGAFVVEGTVVAPGYAPAPLVLRGGEAEPEVRLRPTPPLSGRVVDDKGRPSPGCRVTLRGAGFVAGVWTDDSGRYAFDVVPHRMVDLEARRPGFLPASVRTNPGAAGDELTLQLLRGARVAGRVQRNGAPAMGVRVVVGRTTHEHVFVYTDALGRFLLDGVPADAVSLFADEPGRRSPAVKLERPAEGATLGPYALELEDHLPLRGTLVSDAGTPLAGVKITATREALEPERKATTDAQGRFDFEAVPIGEYTLFAEVPDHLPLYRKLQPGDDHELVVTSRFGENTLVVEVELPERLGTVHITVRRRGKPGVRRATYSTPVFETLPAGTYDVVVRAEGYLEARAEAEVIDGKLAKSTVRPQLGGVLTLTATPGAVVAIQRVQGKAPPVSALELASGTRELRGFGPGTYRLIARAPGELIVVKQVELGPDKPPVALDLRGGKAATLTVTVQNAVGEPVADAELTLVSDTGFRWSPRVRTDADGKAKLDRLFTGRVEVFAQRGNREGATSIDVEPGGSLTTTVVVR